MDRSSSDAGRADASIPVSVIIPVKPGGEVRALSALRAATYPPELMEVLVAYGSAPSTQRNRAARQSQGEILFFLDDDSRPVPGFIERALEQYRDPAVAAVGGPSLTPETDTPLQKTFAAAFASRFGGGGARTRYLKFGEARSTDDSELILCNLSFRREVFLENGGLDERLYPNEENELMDRLQRQGLKLVHDPELAVTRSQRPTYRAFVKQMFGYGRGRGEQTVLAKGVKRVGAFAPSVFLIYLGVLALHPAPLLALPLLAYLLGVGMASFVEAARVCDPALGVRLLYVYPTLHLLYGAGVFRGLLFPRFRQKGRTAPNVEVAEVKPMGRTWS
ncbi:glycosyltransferase family 2 protein [Geomesophilobacter sediminis]|uniref:Glycosyltransferase n=1 Tax=Geomesophilobacter sediminis TaxID=2798584 RepID=A0A8J7SCA8_9BACT|nr:glycosyltransferase [Geomesophilobacter sediminis]MBJ6727019.1 glycosyltransferase [Geomesophilobacter sediminis]